MTPPVQYKDRNRTVPASDKFPGMTQECRAGRCFQMRGVGPEIEEALRAHIANVMQEVGA